jgi:pimeloyl-ACP methyl ester carboxylesterase
MGNKDGRPAFIVTIFIAFHLMLGTISAQAKYPYPISKISIPVGNTKAQMAYMDVRPSISNGKTVVLLHGKNFNGYYWKDVIKFLSEEGYRVIIPDQVGWGRSDKPIINYSFHLLANNTFLLLDTLGIHKVILVGHSMGGMLATRFAIMYPDLVDKLILENPIGLEDYKRITPYRTLEQLTSAEKKATFETYKKYQQSYYPVWKPEYEQYVKAQAESLKDPDFARIAMVNALTYQMIYEQPVCYEWDRVRAPTLLIIGMEDRTIVGKNLLSEEKKKQYGHYPTLGKQTQQLLPNASLVELKEIGHIPHIQDLDQYKKHLLAFIN